MKIYFIGAGPGDPELLTIKASKILKKADICIYAGSLINRQVLGYCREDAEFYDSAKMNLEEIRDIYIKARDENKELVRLHSGSLTIYSSVCEQAAILDELGIEYELIPGISSFQASAAAIKKELTLPEINQTVILTRMEGRTPVPEEQKIEKLAESKSTMCIFLSTGMIDSLAKKLQLYYTPETPAAVVYKASWPEEIIIKGNLKNISERVKEKGLKKTAMIIIGESLSSKNKKSKLYDKNFKHEYRK